MRNLLLVVAVVALIVMLLALLLPGAFAHFNAMDVAWMSALLAMAGVIAWGMSGRSPEEYRYDARTGLRPPRPRTLSQGLAYTVIWVAILFAAMAIYSLGDWAYGVGQMIRALVT